MRTNPERRQIMLDAAIEVLARDGARGMTFRAVDTQAEVPAGTASNYFANRDELLIQVGSRFYERLLPGAPKLAEIAGAPHTREAVIELLMGTVDRVTSFRTGYLAQLELRLEATRRPELQRMLTERVRADIEFNVRNHLEADRPGDEDSVLLLYLALNWLVVERLTLPEIFTEKQARALIRMAAERAIPEAANPPRHGL